MLRHTRVLFQHRQPMIRFLGRRHGAPQTVDHAPQPHPASPTHELPNSFATYRKTAQQHGPLGGNRSPLSSKYSAQESSVGGLGSQSGHSMGSIQPGPGEYFDRSELPKRFQRMTFTADEMEAVDSGGASMWA